MSSRGSLLFRGGIKSKPVERARLQALTIALAIALCLPPLGGIAEDETDSRIIGNVAPEIELITGETPTTKFSSLRGKWILIQCGGAWHRNSQATGQVFAHIRRALEEKPFELIEFFDDPTVLDVQLFSFRTPVGIRALVAKKRDLDFFQTAYLPAWYLVDPTGVVRWAGGLTDPSTMRHEVGEMLSQDPEFRNACLDPTPKEEELEKMMFLYINKEYAQGEAAAEKILKIEPGNEVALQYLHFCASWTKGYSGAGKLLADHLVAIEPSDRMLIYQALYRYLDTDTAATRDQIRKFAEKYSVSRYMSCILLMFDKLPDALTRNEEDILETAKNTALDEQINVFRGFVYQSQGRLPRAESLFRDNRSRENLSMLPLVANLTRQGRDAEARKVIPSPSQDLDPKNATPRNAWLKMHTDCVMQDWKDAAEYAKRYQTVRTDKAQGILVEWLTTKTLGQNDLAAELHKRSLDFIKSSEKYRVAADILGNNKQPTAEVLTHIDDLNSRFDTALLFILLAWDNEGWGGAIKMLEALQLAFKPPEWPYAVLEQLRTFTLPQLANSPHHPNSVHK